jgi:hypothetical protein
MKSAGIGLGIGAVMAALGVFIAARLVVLGGAPLTGTWGLDLAFAVFFLVRGGLQYRRWRQAREHGRLPE